MVGIVYLMVMDTNAATTTRTPSTNPMDLVHIEAQAERQQIEAHGFFAGATCQAITRGGNACSRTATAKAWGNGPRKSGHIALCRTHAASRYLVDADPSL